MSDNKSKYQHDRQKLIFNSQYSKYQRYHLDNWRISYLNRIFDGINLESNDVFLDIGVGGSGYTVIEAARRGVISMGTDISIDGIKKALTLARETLNVESINLCKFGASIGEELPFSDNTFTKVCSIAVLEHIPDDKKAIDEIARVTKYGGKIFIMVPNTYERTPFLLSILNRINDYMVGHLRHYNAEELINEFKERGFELDELIYHAHSIKILQFIITHLLPSTKNSDSRLWWKLEKMDLEQNKNPKAMDFSIIMTKKECEDIHNGCRLH